METIRSFDDSLYTGKINIDETEIDQINRLENILKFNNKSKPKTKESKDKKRNIFDSVNALYKGRELTLSTFRNGTSPIKAKQGEERLLVLAKQLEILAPKQMLQRLPIDLAQVKARKTSENLLNEIKKLFLRSKRIY